MIDSNTYNEFMRIGSGKIENASYTTEDMDNSPVKRQVDNATAEAELSPEERKKRYEEGIAYMNSPEAKAFYKLLRRHECNPFNALFYDKEPINEEQIKQRVERASKFFNLPIPIMVDQCEGLAKITFTTYSELGSEIHYDVDKLQEVGINNLDAFDAMLTHELSHQFLADKTFNFCQNADWCKELACDFIVGVRCSSQMIASGKYKYAVSIMKASDTHPSGEYRLKAVKKGFDFAEWLMRRKILPTVQSAMPGITQFLCSNSKSLNNSFIMYLTTPQRPATSVDVMDLPDTNLIKQYVLKHRIDKKT